MAAELADAKAAQADLEKALIAETEAAGDTGELDALRAELEMAQTFLEAYQALVFAHFQASTLQSEIMPAVQKSFDAVNEGYRFGKFGFLDVVDSQKTLFQTKEQYLDALAGYHKALAEVNRMTNGLGFVDNIPGSQATRESAE